MRTSRILFSAVVAAAALAAALVNAARVDCQEKSVAFIGAAVIPMVSEEIHQDYTVLVTGDRIEKVGPSRSTAVPAGAVRVDARGKFLIPGMGEMHGHIPPPTAPAEFTERVLFLFLANGVTTVRGMQGAPNQLELRGRANSGEILSPTLYLAGPPFNEKTIQSAEEAEQRVRRQKAEGWDLLKVHTGLTREQYDAMARTAWELGIGFGGHVPSQVGLPHALAQGQETIDHLDGYIEHLAGADGPVAESKILDVANLTKGSKAWVVPTMVLWETVLGSASLERMRAYPELKYMPAQQVDAWTKSFQQRTSSSEFNRTRAETIAANRMALLKILNREGVRILFGTDAPQMFSVPGFSIHREAQAMLQAGMTPFQIIRSATRSVGEYFKDKDLFGTIEEGRRADLVLLEANPLRDIAHLAQSSGVMVRGRWIPKEQLQQHLVELAR